MKPTELLLLHERGFARIYLAGLATAGPQRYTQRADERARLAEIAPLALGGPGATPAIAESIGARRLHGDPVTAAELVAAEHRPT